ncbi:MAG: serine/threonine protein kinase, partial [Labilithrix sp.]|nr:serine/threonine protein kinase [Labilithrix sp.]
WSLADVVIAFAYDSEGVNGSSPTSVERYELLGEVATGGMATVYFGRQRGALGFARTVAIKSMHPQLAKDPSFRAMFIDEAHLTARIRHPNVVPTLDIVESETKLLIVMEYVEGVALSALLKTAVGRGMKLPVAVVSAIVRDLLEGLHAAHELTDEVGAPLGVVHRDVSPQNILVGVDGIARVVDFGVAKATGRSYKTQTGEIRGKVGYMAPEQMFGEAVDRRTDVYATGVVLWEALAGERLFNAPTDAALVLLVTQGKTTPPSLSRGERLPDGLDALVTRALSQEPAGRYDTAAEMSRQLVSLAPPASREEVGRLVRELASEELGRRGGFLRQSTPSLQVLEPEAKAVLDVLTRATVTRATMTLDPPVSAHTVVMQGEQRRPFVPVLLPVLAAMAVLSTLFLISTISFVGRNRERSSAIASSVAPAIPAPVAAPPSAIATAAPPVPPADPPGDPSAKVARPGPSGTAKKTSTKSGASTTNCALPYTTDKEGHRHYKAECLK